MKTRTCSQKTIHPATQRLKYGEMGDFRCGQIGRYMGMCWAETATYDPLLEVISIAMHPSKKILANWCLPNMPETDMKTPLIHRARMSNELKFKKGFLKGVREFWMSCK